MRCNENGLTLEQWREAATQGAKWDREAVAYYGSIRITLLALETAWEAGEDPTEWAAAFEKIAR
jgi:hypothetical protein